MNVGWVHAACMHMLWAWSIVIASRQLIKLGIQQIHKSRQKSAMQTELG